LEGEIRSNIVDQEVTEGEEPPPQSEPEPTEEQSAQKKHLEDTLANRREQLDAMADGVGKFAGMKEATIDLIKKGDNSKPNLSVEENLRTRAKDLVENKAEYVLGMYTEDGDHAGELVPLVFGMPADIVPQDQDQQQ
jgi:hypothetical protein